MSEFAAVTVNRRGEDRPAFCCEEHAALWLLRRATWRAPEHRDLLAEMVEALGPELMNGRR